MHDSPFMTGFEHGVHLQPNFLVQPPVNNAVVGVIMGSRSDYDPCMKYCLETLNRFEIPFEAGVTSAHRTEERMIAYAKSARERGLKILIACAGGSAHLPGMTASATTLPVLGVAPKKGDDAAMWSMVQMPAGVPLDFAGFDKAGGENAAFQALRILAITDKRRHHQLETFIKAQQDSVPYACLSD